MRCLERDRRQGRRLYPITYQTWLIAYAKQPDAAKRDALVSYIRYLLGDGQRLLPALDYAPLLDG